MLLCEAQCVLRESTSRKEGKVKEAKRQARAAARARREAERQARAQAREVARARRRERIRARERQIARIDAVLTIGAMLICGICSAKGGAR